MAYIYWRVNELRRCIMLKDKVVFLHSVIIKWNSQRPLKRITLLRPDCQKLTDDWKATKNGNSLFMFISAQTHKPYLYFSFFLLLFFSFCVCQPAICVLMCHINLPWSDILIGAEQMEIQDCPGKIHHEKCIRHLCNLPNHLFLISSLH